jgi:hypothetical protein
MYLIRADYVSKIQVVNLAQVIQNNDEILNKCELVAQEECIGHLVQKYDVASEFTDTTVWRVDVPYYAYNRVYLDAPLHTNSDIYNTDDLVLYNGKVYICVANGVTGIWSDANFDLIGNQYQTFYVKYPAPVFDYKKYYRKNDVIFWKDRTYTCIKETRLLTHDDEIQYYNYESVPLLNVFPDDPNNGHTQWLPSELIFEVPAGTPLSNSLWAKGDNRNQLMLSTLINVVLFYAHQSIAPRNIPQRIIDNYTKSITDLTGAARGEFTFRLPLIQPKSGNRVRYGGPIKNNNTY